MAKTVAVFFGGRSNEREISVITGMLAVNLLRGSYRVLPIFLTETSDMVTSNSMRSPEYFKDPEKKKGRRVNFCTGGVEVGKKKVSIDCALNCCHGGMGEDGTLSALLEFYKIPSASPALPISAVFMDKTLTKLAAEGLKIPTVPAVPVHEKDWKGDRMGAARQVEALGYPVVVKPARLGSSIGVKVAKNEGELARALELAFRLDEKALVEKYLEGKRDINCAVWRKGDTLCVSPLEEVFSGGDILTFSEKYEDAGKRESEIPAKLPEPIAKAIREATRTLYEAFDGRGVVRADFLVVGEEYYFNELNTVPGSLSCYLFGRSLTDAKKFLCALIEEGAAPRPQKELITSGILSSPVFGTKGKRRSAYAE